jgi:hypothetical protein
MLVGSGGADAPREPGSVLGAALELVAVATAPVPFAELAERLAVPPHPLAEALIDGFDRDAVAFHAVAPAGAGSAGPCPQVSSLARSQAAAGALVTTLRNQVVRLTDEPTARLLRLLDGRHDRAAILRDFAGPLTGEALEAALAEFARLGLLLA